MTDHRWGVTVYCPDSRNSTSATRDADTCDPRHPPRTDQPRPRRTYGRRPGPGLLRVSPWRRCSAVHLLSRSLPLAAITAARGGFFVKRWTRSRAAAARHGAGAAAVTSLPVRTFKIENSFYADLVSGVFLSGFVEKAVNTSASGIRLDL